MKNFVVYLANGQIIRAGSCQDETFELQKSDGELLIEALYTGNQYVDNGILIEMPPQPSINHVFDYDSKKWVFDTEYATQQAYYIRDQLLRDGVDRISPVWWASMTPEQQQAWIDYRQALLDIPQQPNFPHDIVYPVKPEG